MTAGVGRVTMRQNDNRITRSSRTETRTVRMERKTQGNTRNKVISLCMAVAVLMTLQIVGREMIVRSSYELVSMKSKTNTLQKENEFMKIELAGLNSPDQIQKVATTQLGMVVPERVHYVQVVPENNSAAGVAQLP